MILLVWCSVNSWSLLTRYKNWPPMGFDKLAAEADQVIQLSEDQTGKVEYPVKWVWSWCMMMSLLNTRIAKFSSIQSTSPVIMATAPPPSVTLVFKEITKRLLCLLSFLFEFLSLWCYPGGWSHVPICEMLLNTSDR